MAKKVQKFEDKQNNSSIIKNPAEVQAPAVGLTAEDKQAIVSQSLRELVWARRYKQGKIRNWQKNEEMYYGKKMTIIESRSNVDLGQMQEHVHTIMSQVQDGLIFKFNKRKDSQLKRAQRLNSLREYDAETNFWDIKDIVGKKQCIIYGRAAYVYYADSVDGIYKSHLENIDIYDLLVDPAGGGIDVEQMLFWGRYGILKSHEEIKQMLDGETDDFMKESLQALYDGSGNNTESSQEETNKWIRMYGQNTVGKKELQSDEKYKFWEWYTTYKGTRYIVTLQSTAGRAISICPLNEKFESNLWPLLTYAAFMDLTEFWTPSYCDYVRDILMNQNISINQMNDNAEAINKPMKVVNVAAFENLAELKYRRDGLIKTRGDFDADKALQIIKTPSIETPIQVFNILEAIKEKASGVTSVDKGVDDPKGKVAIYQGNKEAIAGRYGLFNKSYSFMYNRFSILYQLGVREHLVKRVAIDIVGPEGVETESIKRSDIFRANDSFRVSVESSNAARNESVNKMNVKILLLDNQQKLDAASPIKTINSKKAFEIKAKIAGFEPDVIRELMDVEDYGDEELMSEAARDIESILDGEVLKPNSGANNAYKQKFVDYMKDHEDDMTDKQFKAIVLYVRSLDKVIYANEARSLMNEKTDIMNKMSDATLNPPQPGTGAPVLGNYNNGSAQQ